MTYIYWERSLVFNPYQILLRHYTRSILNLFLGLHLAWFIIILKHGAVSFPICELLQDKNSVFTLDAVEVLKLNDFLYCLNTRNVLKERASL